MAGYRKCSNKTPMPLQICNDFADTILRLKILVNVLIL